MGHGWPMRIDLWTDLILHAADTLWHACIDFLTYSDDHLSRQSGLCPSGQRSWSSRRGYKRIISSSFEMGTGVKGLKFKCGTMNLVHGGREIKFLIDFCFNYEPVILCINLFAPTPHPKANYWSILLCCQQIHFKSSGYGVWDRKNLVELIWYNSPYYWEAAIHTHD